MILRAKSRRSLLLLVSSWSSAPKSIHSVNELMTFRRRRASSESAEEEILGIWCRPQLDSDLPPWKSAGSSLAGAGHGSERPLSAERPGQAAAGVWDSFSLQGVWSLCRIGADSLPEARSPQERRIQILETLVQHTPDAGASEAEKTFCPVFSVEEDAETLLKELRDQYPNLIDESFFIHDGQRGLLQAEQTNR